MVRYEYYKPATVAEAVGLMSRLGDGAAYVAGGTDVMVLVRQKKLAPTALVSLLSIGELGTRDGLTIGACVTHGGLKADPFVKKHLSALHDAVSCLGSTQIRNVATIGGNICNAAPSADTACPLLVLDAEVLIEGPGGERRAALDDFFVGPGKTVLGKGELVKGLRMPAFGETTGSAYIKHTRRNAMDLPIIGIAVRVTLDRAPSACAQAFAGAGRASEILERVAAEGIVCKDARIAMGVVAPRPVRAKGAEGLLAGRAVSADAVASAARMAASESSPRDSVRGEAWYRREMVEVLVKRAVVKAMDRIVRPGAENHPDRAW